MNTQMLLQNVHGVCVCVCVDDCRSYLTANTTQFTRSYLSLCDDLLKVYTANRHELITSAFADIWTAHVNCVQKAATSDTFKQQVLNSHSTTTTMCFAAAL